jgi:hypothetical protein
MFPPQGRPVEDPRNAERPRAADAAPASSRIRAADRTVAPLSETCPAAQRPAKTSGPLRRFKDRLPLPGKSRLVPCTLSWRFDAPRSLVCGWIARTFGSPHSRNTKPRTFPTGPAVSLHPPSTASVSGRFHPPSSLSPPSESCGLRPASRADHPAAGGSRSASLGVPFPHRGNSRWRPLIAQGTRPHATFRPRRFSRPRRFAPPLALRVYFAPQPRPGFALQGIVPRTEPYRVSPARSCPPGVGHQSLRCEPRQLRRPRLQGLVSPWRVR